MSYYPLESTIAWHTLKLFEQLPKGTRLSYSEIADKIDQHRNSIIPCIKPCLEHGLLKKTHKNGMAYVEIGDGTPLEVKYADRGTRSDDGKPVVKMLAQDEWVNNAPAHAPTNQWKGFDLSKPAPVSVLETPSDEFRYTYSSDGIVAITKGGQKVELTLDECDKISKFVNAMSLV